MSSSSAMTKKGGSQEVDKSSPPQQSATEVQEHSAKADASAGLNLNIFGALSGAFGSKSEKETAADGSSVEQREERAKVKGAGAGDLDARGAASAEEKGREMRRVAVKGGEV
ncbi:hypothetical protein BAUCODRAFT_144865 [Baudoinia panamericana UAMH 10762]|uniref:Uncharacterized protein n=1 Tax=Baudoinia panamericana (strain UAMH 10762) TaxID=717646 RepID=M2N5Y5_BAUPA|nr:uncharacterized protein BAUCODRAFT_144865 [Baudoinia panamericana UAMH 10762]EMC99438.1 hypothetical protein BAUCODRAFT_144865 [Baudoinia panamericana UAMH 10762]